MNRLSFTGRTGASSVAPGPVCEQKQPQRISVCVTDFKVSHGLYSDVLLTFKLGDNVACRGESSDAAVPGCSVATSTRTQILIL